MGYTSTGTEDVITIEPPLNPKEIRDWPQGKLTWPCDWRQRPTEAEIQLLTTDTTEEREDGDLIRRSGYAVATVEPYSDWKRNYTVEQLQAVVDTYPGHEFRGFLEFLGEDGQRSRLVVNSERIVKSIEPELVWPS